MLNKARKDDGLVYRGECDLIHIADGERAEMGERLAHVLSDEMRADAVDNGSRSYDQAYGAPGQPALALCPGCYMVALFNAAVTLAKENGQNMSELGNSMADAFRALADGGVDRMESIAVALDPPDDNDSILAAGRRIEADIMRASAGVEDVTMFGTLGQYAAQGGMVL